MKSWRITVRVVVCCALAFVWLCGPGCRKNETLYEGKPESFWIEMLKDSDSMGRREAILALGKMPPDPGRVVPLLTGALRDQDAVVRFEAARALRKIGPEARSALVSLETLAKDDPKTYVRKEAAKAIRRIGNP